jgi:monoamine oxidase
MDVDVIIVGAGIAGLTTAALLVDTGLTVMVLEAGARPGGRVKSLRDSDGRHLSDLGPSWVWPPYQPILADWLERLGVDTFAQFEEGEAFIEMEGRQTLQRELPPQSGIRRIEGGPSALIDALLLRIPDHAVVCNTPVRRITQIEGGVEIGLEDDVVTGRRLVMAAPLRVAAELDWRPDLPDGLTAAMHATPTWMAAQAKAVAVYDTPFWREQGFSGRIASQIGPLGEVHDLSGDGGAPAALFGFVGWPPEMREDEDLLTEEILYQFARCFGEDAEDTTHMAIEDWANNPFICTETDRTETPRHPEVAPDILREAHADGRIVFAVAEVGENSPGLIEGAFDAAQVAAAALIEAFALDAEAGLGED